MGTVSIGCRSIWFEDGFRVCPLAQSLCSLLKLPDSAAPQHCQGSGVS